MIGFFIVGLILHAAAMAVPAVLRDDRQLNRAVNLLNTLALVFGLLFSLNSLLTSQLWEARLPLPFVGTIPLACDGITLFFLFTFQLLSLAGSVYAIGYLEHYVERGVRIRWHLVSFTLLILSLQLVVVVQHALAFLIAWELMAVSAYFSIVLEKNRPEVRRGGFWYFVATHASALFLYVFFIVLHDRTGSWDFADFARQTGWDAGTLTLLLVTGFLGFAIKAGFMPFHAWLPNAHPAAPAHVSGLLSAINIKAGIYGIARMFMFFPTAPQSFGWALLAVALISAIGGVWYALAQHEIKRLLAYHSVENIGIIGLGLAVAWLGRCVGAPGLVALGLAGALFHTLNHAIFKALLFFGAGNVYLYTHTSDIERLGGLAKALPVTGVSFLIGAVSICGLPPFNGFVSEFLIYKSFFQGGSVMGGLVPLVLLVSAVGLAFVGGLAVACFTKLYGIVFLGENRLKISTRPYHEAVSSFPVLLGLATLCVWIGFAPSEALRLVALAVSEMSGVPATQLGAQLIAPLGGLTAVFGLLFAMTLLTLIVKVWTQKKVGVRLRETWGCGYRSVTARMQYSASSFAEELVKLGQPMLGLRLHWKPIAQVLPEARAFKSHGYDQIEEGLWVRLNRAIGRALMLLRWIQSGNIRHYVLYIFAALIIYLIFAFVW
jgi:formate hydrogenlyase subunit 3/multisubunit Na+/H+ antiporter MnhD subunit